jgi:hypothetical protein
MSEGVKEWEAGGVRREAKDTSSWSARALHVVILDRRKAM